MGPVPQRLGAGEEGRRQPGISAVAGPRICDKCADYEWTGYEPQSFSLDELVDELLPQLEQDGIATGVFYTPGARDVMPSAGLLLRDLDDELKTQRNP